MPSERLLLVGFGASNGSRDFAELSRSYSFQLSVRLSAYTRIYPDMCRFVRLGWVGDWWQSVYGVRGGKFVDSCH